MQSLVGIAVLHNQVQNEVESEAGVQVQVQRILRPASNSEVHNAVDSGAEDREEPTNHVAPFWDTENQDLQQTSTARQDVEIHMETIS